MLCEKIAKSLVLDRGLEVTRVFDFSSVPCHALMEAGRSSADVARSAKERVQVMRKLTYDATVVRTRQEHALI